MGIQPPSQNILAINLPLRGDSFALFLRNSQRLYVSIGRFQVFSLVTFGGQTTKTSILLRWGNFSSNFQSPLAAKLLIGSKKLAGAKNGTGLLYHHAKYGRDRGSRAGCRRKSVMFFVCLSRFWNDEVCVCDNGNTMKQCIFQNSYGVIT